ncbi:MAG: hypothetical protein LH468_08750 [Nocardioides sp.]|nr:hypothetical protein [Nocardioides sp.]
MSILTLTGLVSVLGAVLLAGPASADVPLGWSDPQDVDVVFAVLVLGGVPLLLFVLIGLAVYLPSLARGERIAPGASPMAAQWLGGPRRGTAALAGPDGDQSSAGGARGRW